MHVKDMLVWSCSLCGLLVGRAEAEQTLFDFGQDFDVSAVPTRDAEVSLSADGKALRIATGHSVQWPGIDLKAPRGRWDLSDCEYISLDVKNVGTKRVEVSWRIDSPGADGARNCITRRTGLGPGDKRALSVILPRSLPANISPKLFGMRGYPGGLAKEKIIDISNINQFVIFADNPDADHAFEISNVRAGGTYIPPQWLSMDESEFFPIIDEYGQFIHKDWPGKVKSTEDMAARMDEEAADLAQHSSPKDWNKYGGWSAGPQLEATGYFRVEKHKGKWWLVDPDGRLFWSHGTDCIRSSTGTTPISDREYLYQALPDQNSPFARFYGEGGWAPHNYYEGKSYRTFNFTGVNLLRKYGEGWEQEYAEMAHRRLRSWGMNTVANWSDDDIYLMRKTPYVATVNFGGKRLEGSEGYWGKFRDVFDPSFEAEVRRSMERQKNRTAGDPWCIGYFVDNEIAWGDEVSLAVAALVSPPDQPAKLVFVEDMKAKYGTIDNLNEVWGSQYASWDAMIQSRDEPDKKKAYADLTAFYTKTAETYFEKCRDAVKSVAPDNLYLGCRFAWVNPLAVKAAEKYCDVISYNFYRREIESVRLPGEIDMPVIVGEFHFGALDRGMFHTGLVPTESQEERAKAYKNYVNGGLRNPQIVGTHWFQYGDQATTGRGDGENYQIGFLDIADTPYPETIQACREVGYNMYKHRLGAE